MYLLAFAESIQLIPDGTLFIHIALILLMIWLLNRTFFKPIYRVISEREKHKGGQSSEADELAQQAAEKESLYSREMLEARSRGYEMIESEIKQATTQREQQLGLVRTEVAAKISTEREELERQRAAAKAAVAAEADKLSDAIAAAVVRT